MKVGTLKLRGVIRDVLGEQSECFEELKKFLLREKYFQPIEADSEEWKKHLTCG